MKRWCAALLCVLVLVLLLAGCDVRQDEENSGNQSTPTTTTAGTAGDFSPLMSDEEQFTERDNKTEYDENAAIRIELNGDSAKAGDKSVVIDGSTVTLTKDATYLVSGTLRNGMLIVDVPDAAKLQLVLSGVNITSETSAALYIKQADKVFVTLVGENVLENGGAFESAFDSNIDGAVFARQDVTFNGSGSLDVNSPSGHGIVGKDDVKFTSGTYHIAAASHAIQANDSVRVKNATITADAGKDGIHCENSENADKGYVYIESGTLNVECEGDGISAGYTLTVLGGTIDITAGGGYENGAKESSGGWGDFGGWFGGGGRPDGNRGGKRVEGMSYTATATDSDSGSSMKGLKAADSLLVGGGNITLDSADDAIHSDASVTIQAGSLNIASGDDAVHAEDTLTVLGGTITVTESYEGLEALHVAVLGGNITLKASDDGINAAGGNDDSGSGGRDTMYGGGGFGGHGGNSNGSIVISGGTLYIRSSGDAMDANGTLEITGGHTTTTGPTSGDTTVLDYDKTGTISGGTFIGTGSSMMAQSLDGNGQGVIAFSVGNQSAGTKIVVKDKNGTVLVSHEPELAYQIVIISTPDILAGDTYAVTVGSQSENFKAE